MSKDNTPKVTEVSVILKTVYDGDKKVIANELKKEKPEDPDKIIAENTKKIIN